MAMKKNKKPAAKVSAIKSKPAMKKTGLKPAPKPAPKAAQKPAAKSAKGAKPAPKVAAKPSKSAMKAAAPAKKPMPAPHKGEKKAEKPAKQEKIQKAAAKVVPAGKPEVAKVSKTEAKASAAAARAAAKAAANEEVVCREVACENLATTGGYCRAHYIKNWKKIKRKEVILKEKKLNQYIEELVLKYPDKYIEAIRQDLANDKEFAKVIHDLDLDESVDDFDMDGDNVDSVIDSIKRDFEDEGEAF